MKNNIKKLISLIMACIMIMGISYNVIAVETPTQNTRPVVITKEDIDIGSIDTNTQPIIITEEDIQQYGTETTDEFGNTIIEIPLGTSISEGEFIPEELMSPNHFSLTSHTHEVANLTWMNYSGFVPVTDYAMPGITITKSYDKTFTLSTSITLTGGIEISVVTAQIGVEVGGSYAWGQGESYSVTVPSGYKGRIAYRYDSKMYFFDNKITYYYSFPSYTTVEYHPCSAEGKPLPGGTYYLQIIAI